MIIDARAYKIKVHDIEYTGKSSATNLILPIFGCIPCGKPNYIDDDRNGYLQIPLRLIGQGEYFVLKTKGISMIDAGIDDGDLVIVRHQSYAEDGQIVVARLEDDVTLKRYFRKDENKTYILHPENDDLNDIVVNKCDIMGIVVKIIKNI